jgi:SAM-dependent methyltransferase
VIPARAVTWHEVENGSYDADLFLWRELAAAAGGPILDLGAGTGRVAVHLAARGHELVALDLDPELLAVLAERAPQVETVRADARDFELDRTFALVIAPMQLAQILGGPDARVAMLRRVHAHLRPGATFAAALTDLGEVITDDTASPPLPDMLERDGWVFSSQPVSLAMDDRGLVVERRRQAVSPAGEIEESTTAIAFDYVSPGRFEAEARAAGLEPGERREIPESLDHFGSTVVTCRR